MTGPLNFPNSPRRIVNRQSQGFQQHPMIVRHQPVRALGLRQPHCQRVLKTPEPGIDIVSARVRAPRQKWVEYFVKHHD